MLYRNTGVAPCQKSGHSNIVLNYQEIEGEFGGILKMGLKIMAL